MKKKVLIGLFILTIFVSGIFVDKLLFSNKDIDDGFNDISKIEHKNMLSMMLETEAASGEYTLEERSSWPTKDDGYVFNSTLSKCEKGSKLRWDEENNAVLMVGTTSDKCYVYFDVYITVNFSNYIQSLYTGTQGDNNIYFHNSTLENGAGDNSYRYAGSSETTNNFVCFGSSETICPDDNLYRIIGVFGDRVKLIKWDYAETSLLGTDGDANSTCSKNSNSCFIEEEYYKGSKTTQVIGAFFWNKYGTESGMYKWEFSELNKINLNTNFINNIGKIWSDIIATTNWKIGGNSIESIRQSNAETAYKNEIVSPSEDVTYNDKIGLLYVSDYYYGATMNFWTKPGYIGTGDDYTRAINYNWIHTGINEWTITRRIDSSYTSYVFIIGYQGTIGISEVNQYARAVRPTFYLNSNVELEGQHTGTKTDPYRIKLD